MKLLAKKFDVPVCDEDNPVYLVTRRSQDQPQLEDPVLGQHLNAISIALDHRVIPRGFRIIVVGDQEVRIKELPLDVPKKPTETFGHIYYEQSTEVVRGFSGRVEVRVVLPFKGSFIDLQLENIKIEPGTELLIISEKDLSAVYPDYEHTIEDDFDTFCAKIRARITRTGAFLCTLATDQAA